ncbi:transposase [Micromonospora jinlongensis]|uniref:transposase n=1 Tax=Micromonospora jinlongensis TaxID=1287877 RepID=UPI0015CCBCC8
MGRRYELSDVDWDALSRYLPSAVTGGRPRVDDRRVLNGIVWKIRAGAARRDVPARYGSWQSSTGISVGGPWTGRSSGCSLGSRPTRRRPGTSIG